jgi:hypothetical protein
MLTCEVANFDMGYNCILGRPFLIKFMEASHTTYTFMKLPGPMGVITIEPNAKDAYDICVLTKARHFGLHIFSLWKEISRN